MARQGRTAALNSADSFLFSLGAKTKIPVPVTRAAGKQLVNRASKLNPALKPGRKKNRPLLGLM